MNFGVVFFSTEYSMRPEALGLALEQRGFESLFLPEHTHIPVSRRTPYPQGGELPKEYSHTLDPFVGLAAAAVATKRLKLGTGICLVTEHDPIVLAKTVASLDVISNGRVILGVGAGWNVEEMENHGTTAGLKWKTLRERVEAMRAIWTGEKPEYHGETVAFDPIWSYPKPVARPHPPVLLGAHGYRALRRVVRYCDGWIPVEAAVPNIGKQMENLYALAEQEGRDRKSISVSITVAKSDPAQFEKYDRLGIERLVFQLPTADDATVLREVDRLAKLIGN
jgi:probable F420-dependent oxidoreductase